MKISSSAWAASVGTFVVGVLSCACSTTITEPDTTPVYSDDIASGVEPIAIEKTSIKHPEGVPVGDASTKTTDDGTDPAASPPESPTSEGKEGEPATEIPLPEGGSAPAPAGEVEDEPSAPAAEKKSAAPDKSTATPAPRATSPSDKSASDKSAPALQNKPTTASEKK